MRVYETLYLLRPDLSEEEYAKVLEKFKGLIQRQNGVLIKEDLWGKRDLAYPVQKFMQGYYVLLHYAGEPGISFELEREMRLDERVMKYHTIKLQDRYIPGEAEEKAQEPEQKEEPETTPSEEE